MKRTYSATETLWLMMMTAVLWIAIMLISPGAYDGHFWASALFAAIFAAAWSWLTLLIIGRRK